MSLNSSKFEIKTQKRSLLRSFLSAKLHVNNMQLYLKGIHHRRLSSIFTGYLEQKIVQLLIVQAEYVLATRDVMASNRGNIMKQYFILVMV